MDRADAPAIDVDRRREATDRDGASAFADILACPCCGSDEISYSPRQETLSCNQCAAKFPVFNCGETQIPWLFPEPRNTMLEWKSRYHGFLHSNSMELERLRRARSEGTSSTIGRDRVNRLLQAREQQRIQICKLLEPLELDGIAWPADATNLLHDKIPRTQGLSSYTSNVFRDWAWNNGENEALLKAVETVLTAGRRTEMDSVLTLGAGSCRLSYDIHRRYSPNYSVALDFNPLLLNIGSRVIQGDTVSLCEFPLAPLNASSFAVLQECQAPAPIKGDSFNYVLADALNPPFVDGSFDTVVTPWLIDILPQDFRTFIPRVNRCLGDGGLWVNTGSLAFFHNDESWRYSEEEVLELLEQNGFEVLAAERETVPYLHSPHSSYGRTECIFSFLARKTDNVEIPAPSPYLPSWILDTSQAVPSTTEMAVGSSNHLLKAHVLSSIDGKRTIKQIGRIVARQYGLGKQETIHAVKRILIDAWEHIGIGGTAKDP